MSKRSELLRAAAAVMIEIAEGLEKRGQAARKGGASKVRGDAEYYRRISDIGRKKRRGTEPQPGNADGPNG
jgi:hypothetical protein